VREPMEIREIEEVKEAEEVKQNTARVAGRQEGIAAFFDLDGTLVARPSLERSFFRMLRYCRAIPARNYWSWLAEAVRLAPRGLTTILHGNKTYLRGFPVDRLSAGGLDLVPEFFPEAIDRVAWHAEQGHAIVLVSGTLGPLAQRAARALEAQLAARGIAATVRVCATRLEESGGRWTGRIVGPTMFGEAKTRAARRLAGEMQLDLRHCFAYGDSANDRWLLAGVGQPTAVNPSRGLARLARRRGWPMVRWDRRERFNTESTESAEDAEKRKPQREQLPPSNGR